jgi:hypothetical protein
MLGLGRIAFGGIADYVGESNRPKGWGLFFGNADPHEAGREG